MATALLLALAVVAQPAPIAPAATAPTDDYGYVSWCYGALGGYLDLYDTVMPEVTRIEKAFPGPDGVAAALKTYPEMRTQARTDLKTFTSAITAAEKASPRPIADYGRAAINKGRSVWAGSDTVNKARLAQVWMSWSPPGDCETRAKALEKRSNVLGKALIYNDSPPSSPAPAPAVQSAKPTAARAAPPSVKAAPKPMPAPVKAPTEPPKAKASTPSVKAEMIIDPLDPQPCAGRLEPAKRKGKDVLICKPN